MNDKRRALGRGLGALIPSAPLGTDTIRTDRPYDVLFGEGRHRQPDPPTEHRDGEPDGSPPPWQHQEPPTESAARIDHGGAVLAPVPGATFAQLPVAAIRPNPRQPRSVFDEDQLDELVTSITEIGMLQPIVVRPAGIDHDGYASYELVVGERRWRAAQRAGLDVVPAIVKDTADDALLRDALLENLHRAQLNPLEEAAAYQQLLEDFGCTHEELSSRIGRSRPQISNTIRLLKLPPLVARRVAAGVLSAGHARALLALPDGAAMERLAQRIVAEGLSVRSVEEIVALGAADAAPTRRRPAPERPVRLDEVADTLANRLDTRVHISMGKRRGRFTVEFAGIEDLERIVALLGVTGRGPATEDPYADDEG